MTATIKRNHTFFGMGHKLTDEQWTYIESICENKVTVVNSIAGAGKTLIPVGASKILGMELVYLHATVEEDTIGFTTGNVEEKIAKYHQPLYDALQTINEKPDDCIYSNDPALRDKQKKAWVTAISDTFLRGSNLRGNKLILIDEAQNMTYSQLRKILTRISDDCKVVIVGHHEQCDLPNPKHSGFLPYLNFYATRNYAKICKLTKNHRGIISSDADLTFEQLMKYSSVVAN